MSIVFFHQRRQALSAVICGQHARLHNNLTITIDQHRLMNHQNYHSLFPASQPLSSTIDLSGRIPEAQCRLVRVRNVEMQDQAEKEIILQVIDQFLLQRSEGGQLVAVLPCDYEIQFQILRKPSQVPNRLGEPYGIRFIFKKFQDLAVELHARGDGARQLQQFGRVLGRKFIVQLGFHTSFKAVKKIGKGMTACVYNAINFANGRQVAIKSFKRSVYFSQDNGNGKVSFLSEFKMLTLVNHKNLCQLISVYQTDNSTYVILELYPLSLYGYIQKCGFPSLQLAKSIMINLLQGVAYLHERGIMHRDLKLENIMVKKENNGKVIPVIVDFGLAEYTHNTKYLYTRCGTPGYVAPQVLKIKSTDPVQTYSSACDIFSLGVIFHILLFKRPLFEGKEVKQVIKKNCECEIDFNSQSFKALPPHGRDLFQQMLTKDPTQRITASAALCHPFLSEQRKRLQIEMQSIYQTQYSIYA